MRLKNDETVSNRFFDMTCVDTFGPKFVKNDIFLIITALLIFWIGILRHVALPGFYMDSVNPDYLAARALNPGINNPVSILPTAVFPILGNLYHGVQNLYVDCVVFTVLGIHPVSIRIAQALFGAGIIVLFYIIVLFSARNRVAAFIGSALLATDIAFLMSFRTQFYIILGGEIWLFASIVALLYGGFAGYLISGICMALATYGYFVFGFFAPGMLIFALALPNRRMLTWFMGGAIGMIPYVAGYASMAIALGGIRPMFDWICNAVHMLNPTASQVTGLNKLWHALLLARIAMTDIGNELMMFQQPVSTSWWPLAKVIFFGVVAVIMLALARRSRIMLLVLLPVSYLIVSSYFGSHLWAHHFSVLVPIGYMLAAVLAGYFVKNARWVVSLGAIAIIFSLLNVHQGNLVYGALDQTGGVKKASDALTRLASNAMGTPHTIYAFPDWGFFMPFALLTQNSVPYVLDVEKLSNAKRTYSNVVIAFWLQSDTEKYRELLTRVGASRVTETAYLQRDGRPAFYVLTGFFE